MARDLDFRVRRTVSRLPDAVKTAPAISSVPPKGGSSRLLWVVIIALLVAAAIGVWQFVILSTSGVSSVKTPALSEQPALPVAPSSTDGENSILSPQTSAPLVQIYDSGAGTTAVTSLIDNLKALGYKVESLEKSQFEYDRTYIRYREGMQVEAEKIQSMMTERLVSLKEVKSAGLFDILILYGVR